MTKALWHWRCPCDCAWVGPSDDDRCFGCGAAGERGPISLRRTAADVPAVVPAA